MYLFLEIYLEKRAGDGVIAFNTEYEKKINAVCIVYNKINSIFIYVYIIYIH